MLLRHVDRYAVAAILFRRIRKPALDSAASAAAAAAAVSSIS
jgi:hypothetical protein